MPFLLKEFNQMETPKFNTTIDFELCDGSTVKMSLSFISIYRLKSRDKSLYDRYNATMNSISKGNYDELDTITILYVAYMCANYDSENLLTEEEFIMQCGSDRAAVGKAVKALTSPKN